MDTIVPEVDPICATPKDAGGGRMDVEICSVTRRAAPSRVEYGPTAAYGSIILPTAHRWNNHRVTISGLPIAPPPLPDGLLSVAARQTASNGPPQRV